MLKRLFDIICSLAGLLILSPLLIFLALLILFSSKGGVFYFQTRVGKNNKDFKLFKFRTMYMDADKKGLLTVGGRDPRITKTGYYLRKYKLDELPQLLNVLFGSMSLVGPRPEVRKYVDLYTNEQKQVLTIQPGITDYASLEYFSENELLAGSSDPESTYISEIMPAKLSLNKKYIQDKNFFTDLKIIFRTLAKIVS
jgi:lipopolysaccharide/colanic/teichoic acid biosynthesis glycosyltransferase